MKRFVSVLAAATAGVAFMASTANSAELTLSSWLPPKHPIVATMIQPWIDNVKKATDGRVNIKILAKGLGHPKAHFDFAKDGMADVTYGVHGYTPGRFKLTAAAEFPFLGDSAEATSVAYWRVHNKYFVNSNEHRGVQLLGLMTHGPGVIHNAKKDINDIADFKGMKFRIGGGVIADITKAVGATGLMASATKNYEYLSNGVADGTFLPMESIKSFKITKLVTHHTTIPGGLYNTSFYLVMNPKAFGSLSPADQKAVMSVSGEAFAKLAGAAWDRADKLGVAAMNANGNKITAASDKFIGQITDVTKGFEAAWVKKVTDAGVDGAAAMKMFRAEIANYK